MLSYQHGFHAGNFADLHKHLSLALLLESLNRKSKPWSYLETHSGRGLYDLRDAQAEKTGEYLQGIAKLWSNHSDDGLGRYIDLIRALNPSGNLEIYPGSPQIAANMARADDSIHLMELHPQEVAALKRNFRGYEGVAVHHRDGYEGVLAHLPPKPNRGLVLIDPAYEVKDEYAQVASFVVKALKKWGNASIAIWYPVLSAQRHEQMINSVVMGCPEPSILRSEMHIAAPAERGMFGSGMLLINPPWQIDQQLSELVPQLLGHLLKDQGRTQQGSVRLEWLREPQ